MQNVTVILKYNIFQFVEFDENSRMVDCDDNNQNDNDDGDEDDERTSSSQGSVMASIARIGEDTVNIYIENKTRNQFFRFTSISKTRLHFTVILNHGALLYSTP